MSTDSPFVQSRLGSLDGLRGIAALVVVVHHLSLMSPRFADLYLSPDYAEPAPGSAMWWLTATPVQTLIAGQEAVVVFFVLSGLVVALPVVSRPAFDWMSYYPRRMVRLYVPVIASVVIACVWILLRPQATAAATSLWTAAYSRDGIKWELVINSFDLLFGDNILNNPIWSLRWEVVFSLALPLFVLLAVALRRHVWIAVVIAWALSWLGIHVHNDGIRYMPVFLLGTLIAVRLPDLVEWAQRHQGRAAWSLAWGAATAGALVLLTLHWAVRAVAPDDADLVNFVKSLSAIAALVLVLSAALWAPSRTLLTLGPVRWLGRISFSLYLVHVPIIIAVANVLGQRSLVAAVAISFALSLALAELFTRFVEQPAHRLSRKVGAWSSRTVTQFTARPEPSPDPARVTEQ